jgi:hypothetical protein
MRWDAAWRAWVAAEKSEQDIVLGFCVWEADCYALFVSGFGTGFRVRVDFRLLALPHCAFLYACVFDSGGDFLSGAFAAAAARAVRY